MTLLVEALSCIAGSLVTAATWPKLRARFASRRTGAATFDAADLKRDILQCGGNLLWIVVGLLGQNLSLILFCSIQFFSMATLIMINLRAR